jgi:DNA-binding winged helix-turn-helix (wHTH) protein/Tol biopolymer transport system component
VVEVPVATSSPSPAFASFDQFKVDLTSGELLRSGIRVPIQGQPFHVLRLLLEARGKVVTREELRRALWPEDTFVDFELGVNTAVKKLRQALEDSAEHPNFIETLPTYGYRFIAPVDWVTGKGYERSPPNGGDRSAPSGTEIASAPERNTFFSLRPRVAIAFLSLIIVAALLWAPRRFPSRREAVERKLTSNSSENSVSSAAISPDGKYLAYTDNTGIYLKQSLTSEIHSVPLPPNFSAHVDDWFPDGTHLLVSRDEQFGKASLWSVSIFGGLPRLLADDASGGSVSPDGSRIAFRRVDLTYTGHFAREEWVMRTDGTDPVKVAADKPDGSLVGAPVWSPDSRRIAYIRSSTSTNSVEINEWQYAIAKTLFPDGRLGPVLHWLPDGRLIYTLASHQDWLDTSLWTVSLQRSGKISEPPKRITQGHGWIRQITGSADGKTLTLLRVNWSPNTYIGVLAAGGTQLLAKRRLTLDESASLATSWTPDSKAVLFFSDRNGTPEIFKQATDQPMAERLIASSEHLSIPRVTPDGSEILYISTPKSANPQTTLSIFAVPITGGTARLVLKDVGISNVQCARLPSTTCLYTISKGNTDETYRFDVKGGKRIEPPQIDPPSNWSLSPDGSQRAVVPDDPNQGTIQLRSTSSGKTRELVVKGWNGLTNVDWSADGRSLLVAWHNHKGDSALLNVTLDGRAFVLLHSRDSVWAIASPDGRLLAITEASNTQNVWQIESF